MTDLSIFKRIFSPAGLGLLCILVLGAWLRFLGLGHGLSFHPDERHIVMVVGGLSLNDLNPKSFPYGSFPFYLTWISAQALGIFWNFLTRYDGLFYVGRTISILFGVLGILLTFKLAKKLSAQTWVPIIAAALLALNIFHLQLSRFATVDVILTTMNLAALLSILRLAERGLWRDIIFTGILFGLSLATKISTLSLLLPLVLAFIFLGFKAQKFLSARIIFGFLACIAVAGLTMFIAQPYGFLDWSRFIANNREQISMVRGLWRPPYTVQYQNTAPYFYHLEQMFWYTLNPAVFCLTIFGLIRALARPIKNWSMNEALVLAWTFGVFLIVARYQVKFPRYLLPLYPILMVYAAISLGDLANLLKRCRLSFVAWLPSLAVLICSAVYAIAFVQIYRSEHTYVLASRWIFENVPQGSRILGVHWDDKLPLHLPGLNPRAYGYSWEGQENELGVYESDTPQKLNLMADRLSRADYLVFPTPRTFGSIPRLPDEYRQTTRMFQLLFKGELGFKLVQTVKTRPGIGNLTFNDDSADESLWVYDHPKVVIFQNYERYTAGEIRNRIILAENRTDLPSRESMLNANAGTALTPTSPSQFLNRSSDKNWLIQILIWFGIIELLAWLVFPLLAYAFPNLEDRGFAWSKPLGLLSFGVLAWLASWYLDLPLKPETLWLLLSVMALFALGLCATFHSGWSTLVKPVSDEIRRIQYLWVSALLFFMALRAFQPEIFWGEKPMDFSFLNYFGRAESLPPQDPWAAGNIMHYYYFGAFVFGLLLKLSGLDSGYGYNLAIIYVGACGVLAGFGLFRLAGLARRSAIFAGLALIIISNLDVLRLAVFSDRKINFDLFWASSRTLTSPGINEYPIWSLLFADLHAHLMAYPLTIIALGVSLYLIRPNTNPLRKRSLECCILGILLGVLFVSNTWDFLLYAGIAGVIILGLCIYKSVQGHDRLSSLSDAIGQMAYDLALIGLTTAIFIIPFQAQSGATAKLHYGWVTAEEFNKLWQIGLHFGTWLVPLLLLALAFGFKIPKYLPTWKIYAPAVLGGLSLPLLLGLWSWLSGIHNLPWPILGLAALISGSGALLLCLRSTHFYQITIGICLFCAGCLLALVELVFLMDRMNTNFKFYNSLWTLFGIAALLSIAQSWNQLWVKNDKRISTFMRRFVLVCLGLSLCLGFAGTAINTYVMTTFRRIDGPRPTLDGRAYLAKSNPDEFALIKWINKNIVGTPTLLEAQGQSYGPFTRMVMHTGLPVVMGWDHHIVQRGTDPRDMNKRRKDVRDIYETPNPYLAQATLRSYGVKYILIGDLEQRTYSAAGLKKFSDNPALFAKIVEYGKAKLFMVLP